MVHFRVSWTTAALGTTKKPLWRGFLLPSLGFQGGRRYYRVTGATIFWHYFSYSALYFARGEVYFKRACQFSSGLPRQAPGPSSGLAGRTDLRIQKSLLCSVISALILLYAKSDVDIIRGPHPQKTNGT